MPLSVFIMMTILARTRGLRSSSGDSKTCILARLALSARAIALRAQIARLPVRLAFVRVYVGF